MIREAGNLSDAQIRQFQGLHLANQAVAVEEGVVEIEDAVVGAVASVAQEGLVGDLVIFEFAVG